MSIRESRSSLALRSLFVALCLLSTCASAAMDAPPSVPATAFAEGALHQGEPRVAAWLVVHPDRRPDGARRVGVLFELDPGWHLYWRNPGESGVATRLEWKVEDARVEAGPWPAPEAFEEGDGLFVTYGYDGRVLLSADLRAEAPLSDDHPIAVRAKVLLCDVECIPAELDLSRTLAAFGGADPLRALFARHDARLPVAAETAGLALRLESARESGEPGATASAEIRIECARAGGCETLGTTPGLRFFAEESVANDIDVARVEPSREAGEGWVLRVEGPQLPERVVGVLGPNEASPGSAFRAVRVDVPLRSPATGAVVASTSGAVSEVPAASESGLVMMLLLAFLGGLVLNAMPCVLPVLAIKLFAVAELAERSRRELLLHGLAYTAGVLVTLLSLASVVIGLRSAGTLVGWGFQFQEPLFIAVVTTVVVAFGLNLFGVFEVQLSAGPLDRLGHNASGIPRSFFDGLLGVVLATPCSAPFLGTAVGFAFASSAPVVLAVFASIGLGLAAPFALASGLPGVARFVPRPGPWMALLRTGLGFGLMATAVWLLWVYGRAVGLDALSGLLGLLVASSFALWLFGVAQARGRVGAARVAALGVIGVLALGLGTLRSDIAEAESAAVSGDAHDAALAYSAEAVAAKLAGGKPVFVTFTADWCITCKVNERTVLASERVRGALRELGVVSLTADWTRRDEAIRAELARFGRAGVPLYLVYSPAEPGRPQVLPELLSVDGVVEALRRAAAVDGTLLTAN